MAEGWLKPLTAPLDEVAADDETTVRHRLESCCRMLTASHFWYSRSWHHAGIRFLVRRTVAKQRGSKIFTKKEKKKKKRPRLSPEETQTWRLCFWNLVCRGTLSRSRRDYLAKSQELLECFFFFFFFFWPFYVCKWIEIEKDKEISADSHQPHRQAASLLLLSQFDSHWKVSLWAACQTGR